MQGVEDFLTAGLQASTGQVEYLVGRLPGHDRFDHGARRLAVEIADDDVQTNTAVGQYLVQSVFVNGDLKLTQFFA